MLFFVITLFGMYFGRKIGWSLTRSVLYSSPIVIVFLVCLVWGTAVAFGVHSLIRWLLPNIVLKIIMGFGVGAYVAIPNYGIAEHTVPDELAPRHLLATGLPLLAFIAASIIFAFLP